MAVGIAALAFLTTLTPGPRDLCSSAPPCLPVRGPPVGHVSPNGRLMVMLERDEAFGHTETLSVIADPNTGRAHRIFRLVGDTPLRFLQWREGWTAEFEFPS